MHVDPIHVGDVDETVDGEKEVEVHHAAAWPDDVSDVRDEGVVGRTLTRDLGRTVEQRADVSSERVVRAPDIPDQFSAEGKKQFLEDCCCSWLD